MGTDDDDQDSKVADTLLDPATRAELERWFGLPSFQQVAEAPRNLDRPEDDPEIVAVQERRAKAIANVDPALLEAHRRRTTPPDDLVKFAMTIDVLVDPDLPLMDLSMADRLYMPSEWREHEISPQLIDDIRECTPQAILRDLHRTEEVFAKQFEIVDTLAESRVDASSVVAELMSSRHTMPPVGPSVFEQGRAALAVSHAERRKPWVDILSLNLPNRTVTE